MDSLRTYFRKTLYGSEYRETIHFSNSAMITIYACHFKRSFSKSRKSQFVVIKVEYNSVLCQTAP